MSVSVLFPYRPDGGRRDHLASWVNARWKSHFPEFELVWGEPYGGPFNRSQAINNAFMQSSGDVLIVSDLDTICQKADVEAAMDAVDDGAPWGYGYRGYFNLTREFSDEILDQDPAAPIPLVNVRFEDWGFENVSGMTILTRPAFIEVGGFDEEFIGWGFEDLAFDRIANNRLGPPFRVPQGYLLHLWHPRPVSHPANYEANKEHYEGTYFRSMEYSRRWVR
jgi:hypothetical protein